MPPQRLSAWWHRHSLLGLVLCAFFACSRAADCAPPPIVVPIRNVTLSNNNIRRGLDASVGSPSQEFAFMPGWYTNNTYLYGTDGYCLDPKWSRSACVTFRGGAYDSAASQSRKTPSEDAYPADPSPFNQMKYVADTLNLNDDTSLPDFPMGVALNDFGLQSYYPQMTLGLGINSTLLNVLKSSGKIASRTFSFFAGRMGGIPSAQMEGSMLFGGYDKAKVTGRKFTSPFTPGIQCSTNMVVAITDIVLNFPNGTNVSIFEDTRSQSITACIIPSLPVFMNLPLDPYFANWLSLSNSSLDIFDMGRSVGLNFWNMRYFPGYTPYNGDVTIRFLSGLSIRLPNDLLIVPEVAIHNDSGAIVTNSSGPNFLINSQQDVNANDMAALGSTFLSAAYLMVNQDAGQFTLWEANPTTQSDPVAVDEAGEEITSFCAATDDDEEDPNPSPGSDAGDSSSGGPGQSGSPDLALAGSGSATALSTGGIAGVAVGAVAGGVLIGAAVFWLLRRRKKAAAAAAAAAAAPLFGPVHEADPSAFVRSELPAGGAPGVVPGGPKGYYYPVHEVDAATFARPEMPASPVVQGRAVGKYPGHVHELA